MAPDGADPDGDAVRRPGKRAGAKAEQRKARAALRRARTPPNGTSAEDALVVAPSSKPAMLILMAGLMRSFETTFVALRHSIIQPNLAEFEIEIVVSTDLDSTCSDKDFETGCCVEPVGGGSRPSVESPYKWAAFSNPELLSRIRVTYAPYLTDIVSTAGGNLASRIRAGLVGRQLSRYHSLLVARPDVALVGNSGFSTPVMLERDLLNEVRIERRGSPPVVRISTSETRRQSALRSGSQSARLCRGVCLTNTQCTTHDSETPSVQVRKGTRLPRLRMKDECTARPGLSIITGNVPRVTSHVTARPLGYHTRSLTGSATA